MKNLVILFLLIVVFSCKNEAENKQEEIEIKRLEQVLDVKYVYDTSYILSKEERAKLELLLKEISLEKNIEAVFCSVANEKREAIDVVANKYFRTFDLGKNDYQNRILIIISTETRDFRISLGDNITKYITEEKLLEIKNATIEYFKVSKFYEGLNFAYIKLNDEISTKL